MSPRHPTGARYLLKRDIIPYGWHALTSHGVRAQGPGSDKPIIRHYLHPIIKKGEKMSVNKITNFSTG